MGEFVLNKLKESIENKLKMIFSVLVLSIPWFQHSNIPCGQHKSISIERSMIFLPYAG